MAKIIDKALSILMQFSIAFSRNLQSEENTPGFMGSGIGTFMSMAISMASDSVMNLRFALGRSIRML